MQLIFHTYPSKLKNHSFNILDKLKNTISAPYSDTRVLAVVLTLTGKWATVS
jgi:hypothetical protein